MLELAKLGGFILKNHESLKFQPFLIDLLIAVQLGLSQHGLVSELSHRIQYWRLLLEVARLVHSVPPVLVVQHTSLLDDL